MTKLADMWRQMASLGAARLRSGLVDLALMAGIVVCLVTAAGYALSALHAVLRPLVGSAGASALMAVLLGIVALALALWLSERRRKVVRVAPVVAAPVVPPATEADAAPAEDLGISAAFLAGFLLARRLF